MADAAGVGQSGRETQPCFHIHTKSRSRRTATVKRLLLGRFRCMTGLASKRHAELFHVRSFADFGECAPQARSLWCSCHTCGQPRAAEPAYTATLATKEKPMSKPSLPTNVWEYDVLDYFPFAEAE